MMGVLMAKYSNAEMSIEEKRGIVDAYDEAIAEQIQKQKQRGDSADRAAAIAAVQREIPDLHRRFQLSQTVHYEQRRLINERYQ
jgi:hypothetical protein